MPPPRCAGVAFASACQRCSIPWHSCRRPLLPASPPRPPAWHPPGLVSSSSRSIAAGSLATGSQGRPRPCVPTVAATLRQPLERPAKVAMRPLMCWWALRACPPLMTRWLSRSTLRLSSSLPGSHVGGAVELRRTRLRMRGCSTLGWRLMTGHSRRRRWDRSWQPCGSASGPVPGMGCLP